MRRQSSASSVKQEVDSEYLSQLKKLEDKVKLECQPIVQECRWATSQVPRQDIVGYVCYAIKLSLLNDV